METYTSHLPYGHQTPYAETAASRALERLAYSENTLPLRGVLQAMRTFRNAEPVQGGQGEGNTNPPGYTLAPGIDGGFGFLEDDQEAENDEYRNSREVDHLIPDADSDSSTPKHGK